MEEWHLRGADHMDHQCLGEEPFNEPARLKERLPIGGVRPGDVPQEGEGREVEERADRADAEHETADVSHLPPAGPFQILLVHAVERDRDLGNVVKQVLDQDLAGTEDRRWRSAR